MANGRFQIVTSFSDLLPVDAPALRLYFLGPIHVTRNGRTVDDFRSDKVRALLAYLALAGDRPLRREALAGLFWPDLPDQVARNNLRLSLHRLRQALDDTDKISHYLHLTAESVQWIDSTAVSIDVTFFTGLISQTAVHPHRRLDTCPVCISLLQQAAELYRGDFLLGFFLHDNLPFSEWLLLWRERLQRQVLHALFHLAEYHRRRGEHEMALPYATRQLEIEPWREEAHRQVMHILAAGGERSTAVKQFETCRALLQEELGIEPSWETAELHHRLLHYTPHHHLPSSPGPFVGRQEELAEITALLADPDCRLLTIVGSGGMGKTRLAMQAGAQQVTAFLDGVCFVPLDGLPGAEYLVTAVLHALHLPFAQTDDLPDRLRKYLQAKELLLILDNFEHLLAAADLVADWLQQAPWLKVLVTSRERLHLAEEWLFDLPGLDYPPEEEKELEACSAVQLFLQVAQRNHRFYTLSAAEKPFVIHICRLVEGSPLAIELAAAQVNVRPSSQIVPEIEQNMVALATSLRNVPERHRSLWAVLDHSWQLLTAIEQETFAALSVFRGGFAPSAARQVAGATPNLLSQLIDKSLVQRTFAVGERFALHELTRQYAQEQLHRAGRLAQHRETHLAYFLQLTMAQASPDMESRQPDWVEQLDRERENIRAALAWSLETADTESGLRLASHLWPFWANQGAFRECRRWLEQLIAHAERLPQTHSPEASDSFNLYYGRAVRNLGNVSWYLNEYETAVSYLERSITIFAANEANQLHIASAIRPLARIMFILGDRTRAYALTSQAHSLFRAQPNEWGVVRTLIDLGQLLVAENDFPAAMAHLQESLHEARAHGRKGLEADALMALGEAYWYQGQAERAEQCFQESLAMVQGNKPPLLGISMILQDLAFLAFHRQEWAKAEAHLQEAAKICDEMGDVGGYGHCLVGQTAVALALGHQAKAISLSQQLTGILSQCHPQPYKPGQMFWSLYPQIASDVYRAADV